MSTALAIENVMLYSTIPFAFYGASFRSMMIELCASLGLISPYALPNVRRDSLR